MRRCVRCEIFNAFESASLAYLRNKKLAKLGSFSVFAKLATIITALPVGVYTVFF